MLGLPGADGRAQLSGEHAFGRAAAQLILLEPELHVELAQLRHEVQQGRRSGLPTRLACSTAPVRHGAPCGVWETD